MKPFTHLHVHTTYSLLDGISRREDLVKQAIKFGMPALSITEHGNMFNAISFYKMCKEAKHEGGAPAELKPIIGMEAYVAPDTHKGRQYAKKGEAEEDSKNGDLTYYAYHLTILAQNRDGYENLKKLSSIAYREGFYKKPRIDDELLEAHKEGLIVLSGCLASKISRFIVVGQMDKAREQIQKMQRIFGEHNFFLEVMNHNIEEEGVVRKALVEFHKELSVPLVMTGDSHYTLPTDTEAHGVALAIGTGKTIQDPNRWQFNGDGYWFKDREAMYNSADAEGIPHSALETTDAIQRSIDDYGFKLSSSTKGFIVPTFRDDSGKEIDNSDCHFVLEMKARQGLLERGLAGIPVYEQRLAEELDMMKRKNFSSYFLIIADIIENAMRARGILPPIGRGSSMGSLVCYCLYIIGLDPIKMGIPFSRFMNEGRKDLPDIDTDISKERRDEVIKYIADKYGRDRVAHLVTFQTMTAKAAADNVGRALGVPSNVRRNLGKIMGELTKEDKLEEVLKDNKKALEEMQKTPDWITISERLEGNNKNLGAHAAGVVISNDPIINHVPLIRDSAEGYLTTQYDMKDVGELGLLKLDMLGLRTLDLIQDTLALIEKRYGKKIDFQKDIPLDDPKTYATVADGRFVSVFQFDGAGIRAVARGLNPDRFEHLIALNALYRPGPMLPGSGVDEKGEISPTKSMMENYIDRRHGREKVTIWHEDLKKVFDDTFGIPLFQEQIMELSKILGGFNDEEADGYRSAIGKKDAVKFKAMQEKLLKAAVEKKGYPEPFMKEVCKRLEGSARYNWNRGHAAGYSYISYVTAWLETNYPTEYFTTLLNVNVDDADQLKILLSSILQKGTELSTPHVNNSAAQFHTDGTTIYMGFYSVRQVAEAATAAIIEDREKFGPYKDYLDFCLRMNKYSRVTKLVKENLVKAGAFDWDSSMSKRDMVHNTELIQKIIKKFEEKLTQPEIRQQIESRLALSSGDYSETEKLDHEKAVLNFYISNHPVTAYQPLFSLFQGVNWITPCQVNDQRPGTRAVMLGVIEQRNMKTTRNGDPYLQLRVCDQVNTQVVNIWSPLASKANGMLLDGQVAILTGIIREDKFKAGENQLNVNSVAPLGPKGGIPINSFYAPSQVQANRVLTILDATASAISDAILNQGHIVLLKDVAYIRPEHFNELKTCGRINYQLVL